MVKKGKMTRSEGLNPPEDPGIGEEVVTPEVSPTKPEEEPAQDVATALVTVSDASPKDLESQIDATEKKIVLLAEFIKKHLKPGKDYGSITFHARNCPHKGTPEFATQLGPQCRAPFCKMSKPFLQKPGSEKFTQLFSHRVKFNPIIEDFNTGKFAYKCLIINRKEEVLGEGRGYAETREKDRWTHNEAMKIAEKRALIDCSLRTYGLSEHFTQDLDDMQTRNVAPVRQNTPPARSFTPSRPTPPARPNPAPAGSMEPRNPNLPISVPQNKKLFLLIAKLGKDQAWLESFIFQKAGIEGVENLTMGWASKFINALQAKVDQLAQEGMETINIDEPKDNIKRETDTSTPPRDVEVADDDWHGF